MKRKRKPSSYDEQHVKMRAASFGWQLEQLVDVAENGNDHARVNAVKVIREIEAELRAEDVKQPVEDALPSELLKRIEESGWTSKDPDVTQ